MTQILPDAEIIRRLRIIRYSPRQARQARQAPSINAVAVGARLPPAVLYDLLSARRQLTDHHREGLSHLLSNVREG